MSMTHDTLLTKDDGPAVQVFNPDAPSSVVIVCEHASAKLPQALGDLGLDDLARISHIAWDPGALAVATHLAAALDATLVAARFSRLAYDCNRPPDAPAAMPAQSEVFAVPGNADLGATARQARVQGLYEPFHAAVTGALGAKHGQAVLVTIHSFTPVYYGNHRPIEFGILHDTDARLADAMLALAPAHTALKTERNQPYGAEDGVTHTLQRHGIAHGLLNVMIELRNDVIATDEDQREQAAMLAGLIAAALAEVRA